MQYLQDIGVDLAGLDSLGALEIVQAPAMGEMTREGFLKGWSARGYVVILSYARKRS
jgi:DCN1-like protein 1/2